MKVISAPSFCFTHLFLWFLLPVSLASSAYGETRPVWQLADYTSQRISSYDRTGGNDDGNWSNQIQPGETRIIGDVKGPGIIKHIWATISSNEGFHLKKVVLRIYWDGEKTPSVEAPIGDFFGLGLGTYKMYNSEFLSVGSQRALNAFFPMPFRKSAKFTITNDGEQALNAFYYNIDWEKHRSLPEDTAYFHAQYRQAIPTDGWQKEWPSTDYEAVGARKNTSGDGNYVILEAKGKGHYLGTHHSLIQETSGWWGEGDIMIFVDGDKKPSIQGTGAEDYYLGAWCYNVIPFENPLVTFDYPRYGNTRNGGHVRGAQWSVYRYHSESPITFNDSIRVTIEHGHANERSDNYYTVAYWYQTEPHAPFPAFPPMKKRLPKLD